MGKSSSLLRLYQRTGWWKVGVPETKVLRLKSLWDGFLGRQGTRMEDGWACRVRVNGRPSPTVLLFTERVPVDQGSFLDPSHWSQTSYLLEEKGVVGLPRRSLWPPGSVRDSCGPCTNNRLGSTTVTDNWVDCESALRPRRQEIGCLDSTPTPTSMSQVTVRRLGYGRSVSTGVSGKLQTLVPSSSS